MLGQWLPVRPYPVIPGCAPLSAGLEAMSSPILRQNGFSGAQLRTILQNDAETAPHTIVIPAKAGNQYAAASRFNHWRLWILGPPLSRRTTGECVVALSSKSVPHHVAAHSLIDGGHVACAPRPTLRRRRCSCPHCASSAPLFVAARGCAVALEPNSWQGSCFHVPSASC